VGPGGTSGRDGSAQGVGSTRANAPPEGSFEALKGVFMQVGSVWQMSMIEVTAAWTSV